MNAICKYELIVTDSQTVYMPRGAKILSVQMQDGIMQMWAMVDNFKLPGGRIINIIGTGNPISEPPGEFIATVQMRNLVWHVFDGGDER